LAEKTGSAAAVTAAGSLAGSVSQLLGALLPAAAAAWLEGVTDVVDNWLLAALALVAAASLRSLLGV